MFTSKEGAGCIGLSGGAEKGERHLWEMPCCRQQNRFSRGFTNDGHTHYKNSKQFETIYFERFSFIVLRETNVGESLALFWASGQPKEEEGGVG